MSLFLEIVEQEGFSHAEKIKTGQIFFIRVVKSQKISEQLRIDTYQHFSQTHFITFMHPQIERPNQITIYGISKQGD